MKRLGWIVLGVVAYFLAKTVYARMVQRKRLDDSGDKSAQLVPFEMSLANEVKNPFQWWS